MVPIPFGAHPTACSFYYDYDARHLNHYRQVAEDDQRFEEYLSQWIYRVKSHSEYLDRVGGSRLGEIRADSDLGYRKGLERG